MNNKKTLRLLNFNSIVILICIMAQSTHAADWKKIWPHPQLPDSDDEISLEEKTEIPPSRTPRVYVAPHAEIQPVIADIVDTHEEQSIEEKEDFMPPQIPQGYPADDRQIKEEYDWDLLALGQENFDNFWPSIPSIPQLPPPVLSQLPQNYPAIAAPQYPAFNAPPQYYAAAQGNNLRFQPGNYPVFAMPQYVMPILNSGGHNPAVNNQPNYVHNTFVLISPGGNAQFFNPPPAAQDEVQGNGKRKFQESNSERMKRRKRNIAARPKYSISAGQLFEELSECFYKNPVNVYGKITFETKTCTWYLDISDLEEAILCLAPQKNRELLKDLKDSCFSRKCKDNTKHKDFRKIYIQALNNGIHYNMTRELQRFIEKNHTSKDEKYRAFFGQFCGGSFKKNIKIFRVSAWDPILMILETTNFEKGSSVKVDKLLYNESLLKAFQEGSHLKGHQQIMNSVLVLSNFLYGDAINIIIELLEMLHADPENYVFEGDYN